MTRWTRRIFALTLLAALGPGWASIALADAKSLQTSLMAEVPDHGDRTLGDVAAPVVMIEYASATCPHCADFNNNIMPAIKKEYIDTGKLRLVFREFPLDKLALGAFMLARCVPEENYFDMIAVMFKEQANWSKKNAKEGLYRIAADHGLTEADADACLKNKFLADSIYKSAKTVNKTFGIAEMPTIVVNGVYVKDHSSVDSVKKVIDLELAKAGQ